METTVIYTPVNLKGNTYRSVKNNNLITVMEVGPTVSQIKSQSELSLKPEYIQLDTKDLVNAILYNKLVFQGHERDLEEIDEVNTATGGKRITFEPGHRYVKIGAHSAVVKCGSTTQLPDSEAKATKPYKNVNIFTVQTEKKPFNTLRLKGETDEDIFVTIDKEFEGLQFTAVKTGLTMEITEVGKTHVSCKVGTVTEDNELDVRFERDFEMYDFIKGIESGRIKPEPYFYEIIEEERQKLEIFEEGFELHRNYFDSSEEPKDFGTDESARAKDFQWIAPKPKKARKAEPKLNSIRERATFKSKTMTHEQLIAWANEAFKN